MANVLLYNPASLQASALLQRRPMSQAQQNEMLSRALQEQMANDPQQGQIQDWRDRSMTPFGVGAGLTGVAAQIASALVAKDQEKKLTADYQGRQAAKTKMYEEILGRGPTYSTDESGAMGGSGTVADNLPPAQREMISRVLQSGNPDMIEAVAGQVLKSQFAEVKPTEYDTVTVDGRVKRVAKTDPNKVTDLGAAPDNLTTDQREYNFAVSQIPEGQPKPSFTDWVRENKRAGASSTSITNMMPGPKKADEAFAGGPYVDWLSGGYANTQKNIQSLDEALGELRGSKPGDLTGAVGYIPDSVRTMVAPQSMDVQQRVEQVVQGGMRDVLGGQYTQAEADAYIKRMYNPKLGKDANIRRIESFRNQLMRGAQAKQAASMYFQKNGTLEGYQGQMPTWDDFYAAIGEKRDNKNAPSVSNW